MAARLLALLAAVAMVVGSLAVRSRLDDGRAAGGDGGGTDLRLVCSTELAQVCEALKEKANVSVEPAGGTAARLSSDRPDGPSSVDGWLVPAPWPDVVRTARQRAGLEPLLATGPVLARSPLVLAIWPDRLDVLGKGCAGGQVTWRCWGDVAGEPGDQLRPGHAGVNEAVGAAVVGVATAGFLGRPDLTRADLEDSDEYRSWLSRLEKAVPTQATGGTAVNNMLVTGRATFDAVGTSEAEAGPLISSAARPDKPVVIYPSPVATLDVVVATVSGGRSNAVSRAVAGDTGLDALARSGWRVAKRPLAAGVPSQPELPPANGLPEAGVLDFVRSLAMEVSR